MIIVVIVIVIIIIIIIIMTKLCAFGKHTNKKTIFY